MIRDWERQYEYPNGNNGGEVYIQKRLEVHNYLLLMSEKYKKDLSWSLMVYDFSPTSRVFFLSPSLIFLEKIMKSMSKTIKIQQSVLERM